MLVVVLPATIVMGFTFPAASMLLGDDPGRIAANAGRLLAANTAGAITATFAIPFFVIPAVGSPNAVAILALVNAATGIILVASRAGVAGPLGPRRWGAGSLGTAAAAVVVSIAIVASLVTPGDDRGSERRPDPGRGGNVARQPRGRDRVGPGRSDRHRLSSG